MNLNMLSADQLTINTVHNKLHGQIGSYIYIINSVLYQFVNVKQFTVHICVSCQDKL